MADDALRRAQELLGSSVSRGDLAVVCEIALTELVSKLEQRKFAKSKRPQSRPGRPSPQASRRLEDERRDTAHTEKSPGQEPMTSAQLGPNAQAARPTQPGAALATRPEAAPPTQAGAALPARAGAASLAQKGVRSMDQRSRRSRYIPAAVKRAVAERDGYQCFFVGADGQRCQERRDLQYHHAEVFARGGPSSVENLHLACAAHNRHQATLDFGASWIEQVLATRRRHSATHCSSSMPGHTRDEDNCAVRAPGIARRAASDPTAADGRRQRQDVR